MKQNSSHPDRLELLAATQSPNQQIARHLETCDHCRMLFDLMQLPSVSGMSRETFSTGLYKSAALAAYERARHPAASLDGALAFDSWSDQPSAAMRSVGVARERRLSFSAGDYTLELVAEKQQQHWECTARLYRHDQPQSHFILEIGRRKCHTESRRCYFWRMKTPPRSITVSSGDVRINFGAVAW